KRVPKSFRVHAGRGRARGAEQMALPHGGKEGRFRPLTLPASPASSRCILSAGNDRTPGGVSRASRAGSAGANPRGQTLVGMGDALALAPPPLSLGWAAPPRRAPSWRQPRRIPRAHARPRLL